MTALPRPIEPPFDFARFLREHGFNTVEEQIVTFLDAIRVLGPEDIESIRRAAHATLAPHPERRGEFDALFHAYFHGEAAAIAAAKSLPEEDAAAKEGRSSKGDEAEALKSNESGETAT